MKINDGPGYKATRLGLELAQAMRQMFLSDFSEASVTWGRTLIDRVYGPEWRELAPDRVGTDHTGG